MATRYGKTFTTRRGRRGRYKYVNGRRVGFVSSKRRTNYRRKPSYTTKRRDGSFKMHYRRY